jgi:hypothetical protein
MRISRKHLLAVAVCLGLVMSGRDAVTQKMSTSVSSEQVAQILANADRSAADRTNDQHPSCRR